MEGMERAKMIAKMEGIEFKERELVEDWILITYDLPATPEGNQARLLFLKKAPKIGAVMHTRSVYLMPLTVETEMASLELLKVGNVFVWTSKVSGENGKKLNEIYDKKLFEDISSLKKRMEKINNYILNGRNGFANRMLKKSIELFNQILFAVVQRGNKKFYDELTTIKNQIEEFEKIK